MSQNLTNLQIQELITEVVLYLHFPHPKISNSVQLIISECRTIKSSDTTTHTFIASQVGKISHLYLVMNTNPISFLSEVVAKLSCQQSPDWLNVSLGCVLTALAICYIIAASVVCWIGTCYFALDTQPKSAQGMKIIISTLPIRIRESTGKSPFWSMKEEKAHNLTRFCAINLVPHTVN